MFTDRRLAPIHIIPHIAIQPVLAAVRTYRANMTPQQVKLSEIGCEEGFPAPVSATGVKYGCLTEPAGFIVIRKPGFAALPVVVSGWDTCFVNFWAKKCEMDTKIRDHQNFQACRWSMRTRFTSIIAVNLCDWVIVALSAIRIVDNCALFRKSSLNCHNTFSIQIGNFRPKSYKRTVPGFQWGKTVAPIPDCICENLIDCRIDQLVLDELQKDGKIVKTGSYKNVRYKRT